MTQLETLHKKALEQFDAIQTREKEQRELAVEDARFVNVEDGQWDDDATEKRADRPRYTIDRVSPAIDQLVGDQRQNRTSVKVNPVSNGADEDSANLMGGLIRNIESQSKATNAYDMAYDETITGGYGGWRILTEFNDDDVFEQDIKIKPIRSAATSLYFGPSKEYDKRDAPHAFLVTHMDLEEFKDTYPDASINDFAQDKYRKGICSSWFEDNTIRLAEYWLKVPVTKEIALLSDGRVIDLEDEKAVLDELAGSGIEIQKTRKVKSHKVQMYVMNGAEFLGEPQEWAGKYIPLVPEYGRQAFIENEEYTRGAVRKSKDAQRIYNYATSTAIEANALTPKDPYWYTSEQAAGYKTEYENFNVKNSPFMPYNNDPTNPGPPKRSGAPSVQTGLLETVRQAENDLYIVTGMGPPALGMNPGMQSGVALKRQDENGDRGSYIFTDNHSKSIQYTGDILLDLIPRIYDTARVVRVLHLDGKSETVEINQQSLDDFNQPIVDQQTGQTVIVNDLSKGKYEASVETGPAYSTQKDESATQLIELAAASPRFEALATDLIAKNLNILESEELYKRIRKRMILEDAADPTDEEIEEYGLNQQPPPDPNQQAITDNINMQTTKMMADIESTDAKTRETQIKMQGEAINNITKMLDAIKLKQETGVPLTPSDIALLRDASAIADLANDDFQTARQPEQGNVAPQATV